MINLAEKLNLNENLIQNLNNLNEKDLKRIILCTGKCAEGSFSCLKKENDLIRLAVILQCAVKVKEKYLSAGISEKIYYDTMSDIKIWCERNQNRGLENYDWLKNHVSFELFRLGRLQFQLFPCNNKTLLYSKLPFSYGEKLVFVHIPEGEKLLKERCIESFKKANSFFKQFFPDYEYRYYFCESWLLFDGNKNFMQKDSNILSFASLFSHCYSLKIDEQAIERIFGKRRLIKKSYPENTYLQKSAKEYMLEGNKLGIGVGVIDRTSAWLQCFSR